MFAKIIVLTDGVNCSISNNWFYTNKFSLLTAQTLKK